MEIWNTIPDLLKILTGAILVAGTIWKIVSSFNTRDNNIVKVQEAVVRADERINDLDSKTSEALKYITEKLDDSSKRSDERTSKIYERMQAREDMLRKEINDRSKLHEELMQLARK